MKRSESLIKTRRQTPADEQARNAQLLIRAGYIHKDAAGVYALLPLGFRVIENIKNIIRSEMGRLGGQEILMTSLQRSDLWQKTDRWRDDKVDIWFKSKLKNNTEVGLAWSHEEQITDMMREFVASYRDLPVYIYQFQTKLRNELRAKSGIMRCREFIMKDLYSYSRTQREHEEFYESVKMAYHKIFDTLGIGERTFLTFASGGDFTKFSHEFQTLTAAGEDTVYLDRNKKITVNEEVYSEDVLSQLGLQKDDLEKVQAAEVGNIFNFGTAKSEQLGLYFTSEDGTNQPAILGSYGIGITRLMGVIAEVFADDKGLVWPERVAPFKVYLAQLGDLAPVVEAASRAYQQLTEKGVSVLYDDRRDESAGEILNDADLLGIPYRVVVSDRSLQAGGYELKKRSAERAQIVPENQLIEVLAKPA